MQRGTTAPFFFGDESSLSSCGEQCSRILSLAPHRRPDRWPLALICRLSLIRDSCRSSSKYNTRAKRDTAYACSRLPRTHEDTRARVHSCEKFKCVLGRSLFNYSKSSIPESSLCARRVLLPYRRGLGSVARSL